MDKNLILAALLESTALRERAADLLLDASVEPVDPYLQGRVDAIIDGAQIVCIDAKMKISAIKMIRGAFNHDKKAVAYLKRKFPYAFSPSDGDVIGLAAAKYIVESL